MDKAKWIVDKEEWIKNCFPLSTIHYPLPVILYLLPVIRYHSSLILYAMAPDLTYFTSINIPEADTTAGIVAVQPLNPRLVDVTYERIVAQELKQLLCSYRALLVDLSVITFASSSAMNLLLTVQRLANELGKLLVLVDSSAAVEGSIKILNLETVFTQRESWEAALTEARTVIEQQAA